MLAARLYGPRDVRVETVSEPDAPQAGQILLRVESVGICGSDLHTYADGRIGDTVVKDALILGHEFAGMIAAVGPDARDGHDRPLHAGQRVAVDPALPCWRCDMCEAGHPNLCRNLGFMGLWPDNGALQEYIVCPARNCFPLPDPFTAEIGALLEPLGVAIHAIDLAKLKLARSVAVLGCGPIGLLIMRLAKLSGATPVYAVDQFPWRLDAAREWGADTVINFREREPIKAILDMTEGHGVAVVMEAAWAGEAVAQAVEMADLGARVVLVGIPGEDDFCCKHSTARRKGLTLVMCRRMKHVYGRAISLVSSGQINLENVVSHRFALSETSQAFALNAAYQEEVLKVMINLD